MAFKRKASGSMVDISSVKRRSGGGWVNVSNVYKRSGGAWVKVWPVGTPISITGATSYFSSGTVGGIARSKSATSALSVSGGTGVYTYAWTFLSGYGVTLANLNSTTILNPTLTATVPANDGYYATLRLTVTSGAATATYDVYFELNN